MTLVRFILTKLSTRAVSGAVFSDMASGAVVCNVLETPHGYAFNDANNTATIGGITMNGKVITIDVQGNPPFVIKKGLFGKIKFPKDSGYSKTGSIKKYNVAILLDGEKIAKAEKIPKQEYYFLDVWKGSNALIMMGIFVVLNDIAIKKH